MNREEQTLWLTTREDQSDVQSEHTDLAKIIIRAARADSDWRAKVLISMTSWPPEPVLRTATCHAHSAPQADLLTITPTPTGALRY